MQTIEIVRDWNIVLPNISIKFSSTLYTKSINKLESDSLMFYKNKIDNVKDQKLWDKAKKLSNDYELIHLPSKKLKSESIALYDPLSRSYFKLWEMIQDFNLLPKKKDEKLSIACLAEGPGGFIEAIVNFRKKYGNKDNIYAITLRSTNKDIPGWKKANDFLKKNPNINILYGKDNTGNIYNLENIINFKQSVDSTATIVTSDGGFDFSVDFNKQEQLSYRIIVCEIITCLSVQKIGGHFVCKFFDLYTPLSLKLIYLLTCFYENVYITKPLTSRPANSEKYIVAKKFKGISKSYLNELFTVVKTWEIIENTDMFIQDIFEIRLPKKFINTILQYNTHNYKMQINNIEKTLQLITKQSNLTILNGFIKQQLENATNWCKKFNIDINYKSNFFIK